MSSDRHNAPAAPRTARRRRSPTPPLRLPPGRFRPPHCPNRHCRFYRPDPEWRWIRRGYYRYRIHPRPLPRFQCCHCRRTFTARTFASTYWLHRWDLFLKASDASVSGSGLRQTARSLGVAHSTIQRHLGRAGRQCLVRHRRMLDGKPLREPLAFDGFESFEYSQFHPCHYNLAAGHKSWFIYGFTDSPLRRKGRMTAEQKDRRIELEARLGRPDPKAVEDGILELLRTVVRTGRADDSVADTPLLLLSDEHPAYQRSIRRLRRESGMPALIHRVTPSTDPRTRANPLFAVNLADSLLRHCGANHRRETIAFNKRRQGGLERLAIFTLWRNAIKSRRERKPGPTAAMEAGILDRRWSWKDAFAWRSFPRKKDLPGSWWSYYWREVRTRALGENQTVHRLKYAF